MITAFSVQNFRAFAQSGELPIKPLTCLVGRNSSGKSSIIHALLLLKQSVEQRAIGSRVPQLTLNGNLIDAGSFEDIVHAHDSGREMGFHFRAHVDLSLPRHTRWHQASLVELDIPRPPTSRYWVPAFRTAQYLEKQRTRKIAHVELSFYFRPEPPYGPTLSRLEVSVEGIGQAYFVRTVARRRVQHWRAYCTGLPKRGIAIGFPGWSFFPSLIERPGRIGRASRRERAKVREFAAFAQLAILDVHLFVSELKLLGPFRTPPARRYVFSGLGAADTGTSGERAVDLLVTEKLLRPGKEWLRIAVSHWLKRLGLASGVAVKDLARKSNMFELSVSGAGMARTANFADVGFGVSQVLPVLVQGFLVPRGATYIVQQPELHLHPDAQAGLADFFFYLASEGIQTIVETHSEYLLLRLRRRLAEGVKFKGMGIPQEKRLAPMRLGRQAVSVVYVAEHGGRAGLVPLEIGDSFQFENLPSGFMSQSIDDRLALMKALRSR